MDEEPIPPLLPVEQMPPIRSQEDLHRHWRALMGPLGFSRRYLWLGLIGADRRPTPLLVQIDELPERPDPAMCDRFGAFLGHLLDEEPGCSVALLLSRPGPAAMTTADRAWAIGLTDAARRAGIPLEPLHLATDEAVRVFAPDDLLEQRTA
jgi:hypothetical protein